ncbi:MAG: barstar family protein [Lachnospiraceae bacterium]
MRKIVLDGNFMKTREEMHDYLKKEFDLPYYYARNLDSLYQILLKEDDPVSIEMHNKDSIALGYGDALELLLKDLASKNLNYTFELK